MKSGLRKKIVMMLCCSLCALFFLRPIPVAASELDENETEVIEDESEWIPEEIENYLTKPDYEVTSSTDENGNQVWYLVNNMEGSRIKVSELNNIVTAAEKAEADKQEIAKKLKITTVVFSIVCAVLLIGLLIMTYLFIMMRKENARIRARKKRKADSIIRKADEYTVSGAEKYRKE